MRHKRSICCRLSFPQTIRAGIITGTDAFLCSCLDRLVGDLASAAEASDSNGYGAYYTQHARACCDPGSFDHGLHAKSVALLLNPGARARCRTHCARRCMPRLTTSSDHNKPGTGATSVTAE